MVQLQYSPVEEVRRARRRRRVRFALAALALAGLLAGAGFYAWDVVPALVAQRECLRYDAPADRVAFYNGMDPPAATTRQADVLTAADPHYVRTPSLSVYAPVRGVVWKVDAWDAVVRDLLSPSAPPPTLVPGGGTAAVAGAGTAAPPDPRVPLFLHERWTPSGKRRLVVVEYDTGDSARQPLIAWVIDPAMLRWPPKVLSRYARTFVIVDWAGMARRKLSLYSGRADPADASRFGIAYQLGDRAGLIEGRLGNDDRVTLRIADEDALEREAVMESLRLSRAREEEEAAAAARERLPATSQPWWGRWVHPRKR